MRIQMTGRTALLAITTLAALAIAPLVAQTHPDRTASDRSIVIPGHISLRAQAGADLGAVEEAFPLNDLVLTLKPSEAQQAELSDLLAAMQDPASPDFHKWLTPAEFADRFGPSPGDLNKITNWLESEGFKVQSTAPSRNSIVFSGTAAIARQALGVDVHRYSAAGRSHFATASEPRVPAAIAGLVAGFRGFDDFLPEAPRQNLHPAFTSGPTSHFLAPDDAATIYNFNTLFQKGYDGTGQTVLIVGQSAVNPSDIANFRSIFNLPKIVPQMVTVPNMTVPAIVPGDVIESDLDLEWAGAAAKNAALIFVYSGNVFNSLQYAVTQNLAPVISISYGMCETGASAEAAALRAIAQQANAQGITLLSASGDSGPFACDGSGSTSASHGVSVTLPASIPEITAVGGTKFNEGSGVYWSTSNNANDGSALSYIPEAAWNESPASIGASGGGVSTLFAKPVWQAGRGVPADGARDVPDVAMAASADHDGAIICTGGGCANGLYASNGSTGAMVVGGTSVAAPVFAGITALVNQYQVKSGALSKAGLGNINPTLYPLAQNYGDAFHDVTTGSNVVACHAGSSGCPTGSFGYQAGPGYDLVTGLGSVNAYSLATDWSLNKTVTAALSSVSATPASVAPGATVAITVTLTAAAPAGGATVVLSGGTSAFPLPASISIAAGQFSASSNVIATTVAASTSVTVTATYSGATKTTVVSIVPPVLPTLTSVSVSPASLTGGTGATLTATLSAAAPAGGAAVALSSSSQSFPAPATLVVPAGAKTASVTVQTSVVSAPVTATITAKFNSGTQMTSVAITPAPLPALTSVSVSGTILTVTLSAAAPSAGSTVSLTSTNSALSVPATIVVPAGQKTASVSVQTSPVTTTTTVTVTARYSTGTETTSITLTPPVLPSLTAVSVSPTGLTGGDSATLTVTLSAAAPTAGSIVALSSNSAAFPVPATVTVPAGAKTVGVTVQTAILTTSTLATVTASYNGSVQSASVTIMPSPLPGLSSLNVAGNSSASTSMVLTVQLTGPAPQGGSVVTLSSNSNAFPVPPNVVVPAGQKSVSLTVQVSAVKVSTPAVITAKYNGGTQTAAVTLTPPVPAVALSSVTVTANPLRGGLLLTVQLAAVAPQGGATVTLSSTNQAFPVPATIVIPAGQVSASLSVQPVVVTVPTTLTITAAYGGIAKTVSLTLAPAR